MGAATSVTDALGNVTTTARDVNGLISRVVRANGSAVNYTYDASGNILTSTEEFNGATIVYAYDANNNLTSVTDPVGNQYTLGWDAAGDMVSFTNPLGNTTTRVHNSRGLPTAITDPNGNTITYLYDANGNVTGFTDPFGKSLTTTLDGAGNLLTMTDALGRSVTYTYNVMNSPTSTIDELGSLYTFDYTPMGDLSTITQPGAKVTQFEYNGLGQLTRILRPTGQETLLEYDVTRNLTRVTEGGVASLNYTYDGLNRILQTNMADGNVITYAYDALGNVVRAEGSDSRVVMEYDGLSRLTRSTTGNPGDPVVAATQVSATLDYSYDLIDQLTQVAGPAGAPNLVYTHNGINALTQVASGAVTNSLTYDPTGLRTAVESQVTGGAATRQTNSYTVTDQISRVLNEVIGGSVLSDFQIGIDSVGNRTSILTPGGLSTYTYDSKNRLLSATHADPRPDEAYTYDPLGNRLTSLLVLGTATFNASNQIVSDGEFDFTYDARSNLVGKEDSATGERTLYTYDSMNRMVQMERVDSLGSTLATAEYRYDAFGRRVYKSVDGAVTMYLHDGQRIRATYDGSGGLIASFASTSAFNEPLSAIRADGTPFVYHRDYLGSVTDITDAGGTKVWEATYDSYGQVLSESGAAGLGFKNPFLFAGGEYDRESGLYHLINRHYDPSLGRFLQEYPLDYMAGMNVYTYVKNNPLLLTDPDGLIGVGALVGAGANLLGQGIGYGLDKKGTKKFSWGSFFLDTAIGAVTCGLGNVATGAYKGIQVSTKIATAARIASNPIAQSAVQTGAQIAGGRDVGAALLDGAVGAGLGTGKGKYQKYLGEGMSDVAADAFASTTAALAKQDIDLLKKLMDDPPGQPQQPGK